MEPFFPISLSKPLTSDKEIYWNFVRTDAFCSDFVILKDVTACGQGSLEPCDVVAYCKWQVKSCPQVEVSEVDKSCLTMLVWLHLFLIWKHPGSKSQGLVSWICVQTLCHKMTYIYLFFLWNHALLSGQATHNTAFDCGMSVAFQLEKAMKENLI